MSSSSSATSSHTNASHSASSTASSHANANTNEYVLSTQLTGHDYAVRDIAVNNNARTLCTLEERGRVHIWQPLSAAATQYIKKLTNVRVHESLAFTVQSIDGVRMSNVTTNEIYPVNSYISGGGDKTARPFDIVGSFYPVLEAHKNAVGSISVTRNTGDPKMDNLIITGDWSSTIRIWSDQKAIVTISNKLHEHSVEVLGHSSGYIVSGSASKNIVIFDVKGNVVLSVKNAHEHAIRKIVEVSHTSYATAANDGVVKVWQLNSDRPILTIDAHSVSDNPEHPKFIYGLAYNAFDNQFITCGEDATVRVFDGSNGKQLQIIKHPAPVRSVKLIVLPQTADNNSTPSYADLITGCADRVARIFTRTQQRYAASIEIEEFNELVKLAHVSGMKPLQQNTVADESELKQQGKKNGEVKVVNVNGKGPMVYQWSSDVSQWLEIGEAIGQGDAGGVSGQTGKSTLDGVQYDYVTEVYITDTQSVKLGFNRDSDPDDVANAFMAKHGLPPDMKFQIVEHLKPMIDMDAVRLRKQRQQSEQLSATLRHTPSWQLGGGFQMYGDVSKVNVMRDRLMRTNEALSAAAEQANLALNADNQRALQHILSIVEKPTSYHVANLTADDVAVVYKLLSWPQAEILPVMDLMRILMLINSTHTTNVGSNPYQTWTPLLRYTENGGDTHLTLLLKIACNYVAKRPRSANERSAQTTVPLDVTQYLTAVLKQASDRSKADSKDSVFEAYVYLLHNIIIWLGRLGLQESQLYQIVAESAIQLATMPNVKQRILYYSMMTLGSIALTSERQKRELQQQHSDGIETLIAVGYTSNNLASKEVAQDLANIFGLK